MADTPIRQSAPRTLTSVDDAVTIVVSALPPLPPVVRYYDEFDDMQRSIRRPLETQIFEVWINGHNSSLDFTRFAVDDAVLLKHALILLLANDRRIETIYNYFRSAYHLSHQDFVDVVSAGPSGIKEVWQRLRARDLVSHTYPLIKSILRLLCHHRIEGWSDEYLAFLTSALPLPAQDKFSSVRSGDAFLSSAEEALIVRHLDEVASSINHRNDLTFTLEQIADAGMLLCAFQFAVRPIQIAMLMVRNVRVWKASTGDPASVHVTFHMAKQRSSSTRMPLTRRVKQEWAPILIALEIEGRARSPDGSSRLFGVKSNTETSSRISTLLSRIGCVKRGATDLRHTAAQRLVDAGSNHEELSEFMGHSDIRTGLVYYDASATQVERLNTALGASPTYRTVAKIAHDRFISVDQLHELKDEQQIAGIPHGIAIAGIGGCSSGQPACPYNPITSCYGCRKFMPVLDKGMHERVLSDLRSVVSFFFHSSRGDATSPAYLQLQHTITEVQSVIGEIEGAGK